MTAVWRLAVSRLTPWISTVTLGSTMEFLLLLTFGSCWPEMIWRGWGKAGYNWNLVGLGGGQGQKSRDPETLSPAVGSHYPDAEPLPGPPGALVQGPGVEGGVGVS